VDGRYLAYAQQNGNLMLYDATTNTRRVLAALVNNQINTLAFSPNLNYLLGVGTGREVNLPNTASAWQIYNLVTNQPPATQKTDSWVRNIAFSADGSMYAWLDTSVHINQSLNNAPIRAVAIQQAPKGGLAWRPVPVGIPPTHSVAFADGNHVRLDNFDANTEQVFAGDPSFFPSVISFNQDGSLLAAMDASNNIATGSVLNIFDANSADLISSTPMQASMTLTFSPDGTLLAISSENEVDLLGVSSTQAPEPTAVG
jgi:WD40 repeat protein